MFAAGASGLVAIAFKWSVAGDACGGTDTAVTFGDLLGTTAWSYGFLAGLGIAFGSALAGGRLGLPLQVAGVLAAAISVLFLWGDSTAPFEAAGRGGAVGAGCDLYAAPGLWLAAGAALLMAAGTALRARRRFARA